MNAKAVLALCFCLLVVCMFGCSSQRAAGTPRPPVSEAELVYPKPHAAPARTAAAPTQAPPAQSVYFGFDKSGITPEAKSTLKNQAEWLKQNPNAKVAISGNADRRADEEYNRTLAQKRADAVKAYLVQQGVKADRLETRSYGKERPVCGESTDKCYSANRRVDVQVTG